MLRMVVHIFHGLWVVYVHFPFLKPEARGQRVSWWALGLLRLLGIELVVEGQPRPGAKLMVSNHVSWLDIMALDAVLPVRFVSKAEVGRWPLVGRLVTAGGTLYLQRESRRDAKRVITLMADALRAGHTLGVFPEGTTGDGKALLPFFGNMLQSAIDAHVPLQPVVVRYADTANIISPAAAYVGDTSLVESMWWIVCAEGLRVHVNLLTAMETVHADRRALAQNVRAVIEAELVRIDAKAAQR